MLFILLCGLFCFVVAFALALLFTQRGITRNWKLEGPKRVSERLQKRNRTNMFIVSSLAIIVAFFEAIIQDFSYWMQDVQADTLNEVLPSWAIVFVGNGSISWALYLSILLGVLVGLIAGTLWACKQYPELKSIGITDVI